MGMRSQAMKRITRAGLSVTLLLTFISFAPAPATAAKIVCKPTTAKPHAPMKTNPPQTVAKKLPKQLILRTNCGVVEIALDPKAPFTVTQIAALARAGYYNKSLCHREAISGFYMLQCGDPTAQGSGDPGFSYPDARNPYAFTDLLEVEGLQPWKVKEVWMQGHAHPDHFVDITSTFDIKVKTLKEHASQTGHNAELENMLREWGQRNAGIGGLPDGRIAEAFKIVNTN